MHYLDLSISHLILMHGSVVTTSFIVLFCFAFDCQIAYGIVYYTILQALPFKRLHTSFSSIKPCIVFTISHYVSMIKKKKHYKYQHILEQPMINRRRKTIQIYRHHEY